MAAALRLRVGLVDADVHGPSIPTMMNLRGEPAVTEGDQGPPLLEERQYQQSAHVSHGHSGFAVVGDKKRVLLLSI